MPANRGRPPMLKVFGKEVRRYRQAAGLSQDRLAEKVPISGSHVGAIERGDTRCDRSIAERFDEILDTRGALPSLWDELVQNTSFPVWFDWPVVEEDALSLSSYEGMIVYGLLQTEAYASIVLKGDKDAVAARLGRQQILRREDPPAPRVTAIMLEYVLHHEMGGPEIMRGQLQHLLDLPEHVSVQVVPAPFPPDGADGAFVVAMLRDRHELAFMENPVRGVTTEETADIQLLSDRYEAIRTCALPVGASRDLIRRVMEEKWT